MATIGELNVIFKGDDQFSGKARNITRETQRVHSAVRNLATGFGYLGSAMIGMGSMMRDSNNETTKALGNNILLAGTFLSATASAFQFIKAMNEMVKGYKALATWQIISKALSGPGGWGMLAGGLAIAGGTVAMVNSKVAKESKSSKSGTTVNVTVMGSVATEKKIADSVRAGIIASQNQNAGMSGIK